ncbi:GNAT family N-acetyltransferase [Myxococcota bacterium]
MGKRLLYHWRFPARVLDLHQTELPAELGALSFPGGDLAPRADAFVVPSFSSPAELPRISLEHGFIRYLPERVSHHWIELNYGSYDAYLKNLRQKARHELKRKVNKLSEHLKERLVFREFKRPDEMAAFHGLARQVSQKTYQELLLDAGLPKSKEFQEELRAAAAADRVRGYLLMDGDRPIAYGYCEAQRSVLLYVNTGYDPAYREWSPGMVLFARMLESLFAEGRFRVLDLDWGEARWKECFATTTARGGRVLFLRCTPRHAFFVGAHCVSSSMSASLIQWLDRAGVRDTVKRLFRSRTTEGQTDRPARTETGRERRCECQHDLGVVRASAQSYPQVRYLVGPARNLRTTAERLLKWPKSRTRAGVQPESQPSRDSNAPPNLRLRPGELVEVRARQEILGTLDEQGKRHQDLLFTEEMFKYCGKQFRVYKRVERVVVATTGESIPMTNAVLLDGATCDGSGTCDRSCFYFWREAWLQRPRDGGTGSAPQGRTATSS